MKDIPNHHSVSDCSFMATHDQDVPAAPAKSKRGRKKSTQSKSTKKERRLLQNRESAFRFRIKRKSEFELLKQQVDELIAENDSLRQQVGSLREIIESQRKDTTLPQIQTPQSTKLIATSPSTQQLPSLLKPQPHLISQANLQQLPATLNASALHASTQNNLLSQPATSTVASSQVSSPIMKSHEMPTNIHHSATGPSFSGLFANLPQLQPTIQPQFSRIVNPMILKNLFTNQPTNIHHNNPYQSTTAHTTLHQAAAVAAHQQITAALQQARSAQVGFQIPQIPPSALFQQSLHHHINHHRAVQ